MSKLTKATKERFSSLLEIPDYYHLSESDESRSAPSTPTTSHRQIESDDSQDAKSSSGSSATLRKAFRRTFSWTKRKPHACKIFVLGFSGVGKTAAVVRFLTGRYIHEYQSSREETYIRDVMLDGKHTALQTTSIAEKVPAYDERMNDRGTGVLFVYSIVDMMSFHYIQHLFDSLGPRLSSPIVLVGTKLDLGDKRCIRKSTAMQLARNNNCAYFEISAALDIGVKDSFHCLMRKILSKDANVKQSVFNNNNNNNVVIVKKRRNSTRRSSVS